MIRGGGLGYAYAFRTRVGFRLTGYNFKYSSVIDLGFRCGVGVNGVYRGGQVDSSSADKQCVSYRSSYPVLSYVNRNVGFRLCKLFHVEQR